MRFFYLCCLALLCLSSKAQFSFAYAPSKWTTTLSANSNGFVNTSGAPGSIIITGSDAATSPSTAADIDYTITALASGPFSFSWSYHSNDGDKDPQYDLAGVLINGTFTQLSASTLNLVDQSGTWSGSVAAGTVFGFRIQATDNYYGNATFTISNFSPPGGVLPVQLISFNAQKQNSAVVLNWQSAAETAFSHFNVERSVNGQVFSTLQTVKALGNNSTYSITDNNPSAGYNYYRLKMADSNGMASYSKTISVDMRHAGIGFSIAPNPAREQCTIHINAAAAYTEMVTVTNSAGTVVAKEKIALQPGLNQKALNIASLPKGVYLLTLQTCGLTLQLVKQ